VVHIACLSQTERQKNAKTNPPQRLPNFKDTWLPAQPAAVLDYDEAWSLVLKKIKKRWLWTGMCRRTRQIIAFVIGDRSENTGRRLCNKVPIEYRTWSDGIALCANTRLAMCARHFHFQSVRPCIVDHNPARKQFASLTL